jgi:hypothetical protein
VSWFSNPVGLWALLAVPAVAWLHLHRRRHTERAVAALFLWEDTAPVDASGRVRQPLRTSPSFWLELLAALLAALAVAGFDPLGGGRATHVVAVLDDSASMSARDPDGRSARDRALARLEQAFDDAGRSARVTLVRSGVRPALLCGPAALLPDARAALEDWQPAAPAHDLRPALVLARELAEEGEVLLLTDALPAEEPLDPGLREEALGEALDNLALLDARRTTRPRADTGGDGGTAGAAPTDHIECLVRSFADAPREGVLTLAAADVILARRAYRLEPGAARRLTLEVPSGTPAVTLALEPDALPLDDVAVLHPDPPRDVRVGWALDEGLPALLGLDQLRTVDPAAVPTADEPQLVIAHAPAPGPAWSLVLPHEAEAHEAYVGPFLVQRRHPLMEGVLLDGIVWTRSEAEVPGLPLVAAGNQPLLAETRQGGASVFQLDAVMERSTLHRSPDWPILLSNLIAMRRDALPGPRARNLVSGEAFVFTAEASAPWELVGPRGRRGFSETDRLVLDDLPAHGDYRLLSDGTEVARFAVNFADPLESDLRSRGEGVRSPQDDVRPGRGAQAASSAGLLLLLGVLGAMLADWLVLAGARRR